MQVCAITQAMSDSKLMKKKAVCNSEILKSYDTPQASIVQCKINCIELNSLSFSYGRSDSDKACHCKCYSFGKQECSDKLQPS